MKKQKYTIFILILLIGIGFAYLSTTLSINGRGLFGKSDWKIYFDNVREVEGSEFVTTVPETSGDITTSLNFEVNLPKPGDKYKFYVDVVNAGDLDAMINVITRTNLESNYAEYKVTYYDGVELSEKDLLKANSKDILLIEVSYKTDIDLDTLSSDKDPVDITISLEYTQSDKTSREVEHELSSFSETEWEDIVKYAKVGIYPYEVGDSKCVHLDGYSTTNNNGCNGDFKVRVANTSSPSECKQDNFSKSACGFVLEFEDIITSHIMNPSGEYKGTQYDYGWNKDGWPVSSMREFVNNDIYNSLPDILKDNIIDTYTISGYGENDNNGTGPDGNWESIDKLYLLTTAEIWELGESNTIDNDSARSYTRQLDYYSNLGVTTDNYSSAIKKRNGSASWWWLRGANSCSTYNFYRVNDNGDWNYGNANYARGVSPAFRIG